MGLAGLRQGMLPALACACVVLASPAAAQDAPGYEGSWTDRALSLQYELARDVPLRNAPWVGTHNSFNSQAEMGPALSPMDSNQRITIVEQLRIDVRSLELDVHWFPSVHEGRQAPVVCHATGEHAGCTTEKPLAVVLEEIGGWLRANRDQALLLYLEDHLDNAEGHDRAAADIEAVIGDLVYRPQGATGECVALPLELTRERVLAAGKQVLIVSGCGVGAGWRGVAFDWSGHEESRPRGYRDYPDCGPDYDRATYDANLIRYFEDSTRLTDTASTVGAASRDDGITPETAARMARCGVDLTGLDQLVHDDGRLHALVWSWAPDEPAASEDCAVQRAEDARWRVRSCRERHMAACRDAGGTWSVSSQAVPARSAERSCSRGARHAVPHTGYEAQLLRDAMVAAGAATAWLGYRRAGDSWSALDSR